MKTNSFLRAIAPVLACALLVSSCKNALSHDDAQKSLTVRWEAPSARTILPASIPAIAGYDVILTPTGGGAPFSLTDVTDLYCEVETSSLAGGTYQVRVNGKDSGGTVVATGVAGVAIGTDNVVSVILSYEMGEGTGSIHLTVSVASTVPVPDSVSLSLVDPAGVAVPAALSGSGRSYSLALDSAKVGSYRLALSSTVGTRHAFRDDTLFVAANTDTAATLTLGTNEFVKPAEGLTLKVSDFAGQGASYRDGVGSAARFLDVTDVVSDGTYLYATDVKSHVIRKIALSDGAVTTLAGSPGKSGSKDGTGSGALFNAPWGIALYNGTLYVVDSGSRAIRTVNPSTGLVSTYATVGTAGVGMCSPCGLAVAGTDLYVTDINNRIWIFDLVTNAKTVYSGSINGIPGSADATLAQGATYRGPIDIASDGSSLFIVDAGNNTIRKINLATKAVSTIAGLAGSSGSADGVGSSARFSYPFGIECVGGDIYVSERDNSDVRKLTPSGESYSVSTIAGLAGEDGATDGVGATARFMSPRGLASSGGFLFLADSVNRAIRKIELSSATVSTLAGRAPYGVEDGPRESARFLNPGKVATDWRYLYVTDGNAVRKVDIQSGYVTTLAGSVETAGYADGNGSSARFSAALGIAYADGKVYVADGNNHAIRCVDCVTGAVTTFAGNPGVEGSADGVGTDATFSQPFDIATEGTVLFVTDGGNETIRKINLSTRAVTTFAGVPGSTASKNAGFSTNPAATTFEILTGIACVNQWQVYVCDRGSIRTVMNALEEPKGQCYSGTLAGAFATDAIKDGLATDARFMRPAGLLLFGTALFVAEPFSYTVRDVVLYPSPVMVKTLLGTKSVAGSTNDFGTSARFSSPTGLATDGEFIYVVDAGNYSIRRIE